MGGVKNEQIVLNEESGWSEFVWQDSRADALDDALSQPAACRVATVSHFKSRTYTSQRSRRQIVWPFTRNLPVKLLIMQGQNAICVGLLRNMGRFGVDG